MGVFTFINEYISAVPPARLFKALILDSRNLVPKLMPQAIKSIDIIQGDGGNGTIRQINFIEGGRLIGIKNRVDELNKETFTYRYSIIDLDEKFESIVHEVNLSQHRMAGARTRLKTYYTKGDVELKEEDVKARKGIVLGAFKATEAYLLKNPNAYAGSFKSSLK